MTLPPSIEALMHSQVDVEDFDLVWFATAIAHEACRLQREADEATAGATAPLVVPSTEN